MCVYIYVCVSVSVYICICVCGCVWVCVYIYICCEIGKQYISKYIITLFRYWTNDVLTVQFLPLTKTTL